MEVHTINGLAYVVLWHVFLGEFFDSLDSFIDTSGLNYGLVILCLMSPLPLDETLSIICDRLLE